MNITQLITNYIDDHPPDWPSAAKYRHHVNAWNRAGLTEISAGDVIAFRRWCRSQKLSPSTYEGQISDLLCAARWAGLSIDPGRRDRKPQPVPRPASFDAICDAYKAAPSWVRQFIALTYWTGLRLSDVLRLQQDHCKAGSTLRYQASKTGHAHVYPVPAWLNRHLVMQVVLPGKQLSDYRRKVLRKSLQAITPQQIRQRGLTEWSRADGMAGQIIHGCGLRVMRHYVDPLSVLESAQYRVRLPDCFATEQELSSQQEDISRQFAKLDPEAQSLVRQTMLRFA